MLNVFTLVNGRLFQEEKDKDEQERIKVED